MNNSDALNFFREMGRNISRPEEVRLKQCFDPSAVDADFIASRATSGSRVLDLGSGTGLIVSLLSERVGHITAVEPVTQFTAFINRSPALRIVHADILSFLAEEPAEELYDLATLFGVMHYFNGEEATEVYRRCVNYLRRGGRLIVKNQFGVHGDVVVENYSRELGKNYFAQYRHIEGEQSLLRRLGYRNIEVHDMYPPECNRWDNTHFYAIVAHR